MPVGDEGASYLATNTAPSPSPTAGAQATLQLPAVATPRSHATMQCLEVVAATHVTVHNSGDPARYRADGPHPSVFVHSVFANSALPP